MVEIFWLLAIMLVVLFGGVVLFGAPYLPTLRPQIETALDLLDLQPGQTLIEIGSGDGRVLAAAAARGLVVVGYELNPLLVWYSRWKVRSYDMVTVVYGNVWRKKWPPTDGVYVFGLQKLLPKVYTKIVQSNDKNVKLVSVGFALHRQEPVRHENGVYLYDIVPTR